MNNRPLVPLPHINFSKIPIFEKSLTQKIATNRRSRSRDGATARQFLSSLEDSTSSMEFEIDMQQEGAYKAVIEQLTSRRAAPMLHTSVEKLEKLS